LTVEDSLVLSMKDLRKRLCSGTAGAFTWTWEQSGRQNSIGYLVLGSDETLTVTLHYRLGGAEDVRIPVRLEMTPTQFGGRRFWFVCPLIVGGVPCSRRAAKLYLPPGGRYFGCRTCHDLTYRSCQEAHKAERLCARLRFGPERIWERLRRMKRDAVR
jgi:hypothetical protein